MFSIQTRLEEILLVVIEKRDIKYRDESFVIALFGCLGLFKNPKFFATESSSIKRKNPIYSLMREFKTVFSEKYAFLIEINHFKSF